MRREIDRTIRNHDIDAFVFQRKDCDIADVELHIDQVQEPYGFFSLRNHRGRDVDPNRTALGANKTGGDAEVGAGTAA